MIRVTYVQAEFCLRAEGHAGMAPKGQDVVCAAVTALMLTAAQAAQEAGEAQVCSEPGNLKVRCLHADSWERISAVMAAIARGLAAIADSYPQYVTFEGGRR